MSSVFPGASEPDFSSIKDPRERIRARTQWIEDEPARREAARAERAASAQRRAEFEAQYEALTARLEAERAAAAEASRPKYPNITDERSYDVLNRFSEKPDVRERIKRELSGARLHPLQRVKRIASILDQERHGIY